VLGPTRSGKSTLLGLQVAQWLLGESSQAFPLDVDGSMRCLTHCLGGLWCELAPGKVRFQPLRRVDNRFKRAQAVDWLLEIVKRNGVPMQPGLMEYLDSALDTFAKLPVMQRTMTRFHDVLKQVSNRRDSAQTRREAWQQRIMAMHMGVSQAIFQLTRHGRYGDFLDGETDLLGTERFIVFEQRPLLNLPTLLHTFMPYLFAELEDRFDTRTPTLIPWDEFALASVIPEDVDKAKEWLMTKAKKNVSLGFATHSIAQIFGSADSVLGSLITEGCQSWYVLPNAAARTPQMADIYTRLGFNATEIDGIAGGRPQRDVYFRAELLGKRLFHLYLSEFLMCMLSRNRQEDHEAMDELLAQEGREGFAPAWFRKEGFPEAAATIAQAYEVMHAAD
jgi:type IV secretory pathway VirB4 component